MAAYILRRLLLIVPTLLGIMLLNFAIIQFAPGGPVEQILYEMENAASGATDRFSGGADTAALANANVGSYRGRQGIDPDLIADLERQFGLDKPVHERFLLMIWNYVQFDFGESFQRSEPVIDIILEKMPVSISLGLWATLIAYLVSIPLGIRKAVRDGSTFDTATSGLIIAAYALPGFLVPVVLLVVFSGGSYFQIFPLRGLLSEGLDAGACLPFGARGDMATCVGTIIPNYFWHITLPVLAMSISGFATITLLTKNSFLEEIKKQYVLTARAKGLTERRVLYGHVFRNAMLIVVSTFPAAFVGIFMTGSIFVETVFSLDGLGLLGFESVVNRDYPIVLGTLYIFGLIGLLIKLVSDLLYVWIDPRIDFEAREG